MNRWEDRRWRQQLEEKETLKLYRIKEQIGGVTFYRNSLGSKLLFQCRSNSIRLNWRERHWGGQEGCWMCDCECETLEHFLMECRVLEGLRIEFGITNLEQVLLMGRTVDGQYSRVERFLEEAWKVRKSCQPT